MNILKELNEAKVIHRF